MIRGYNLKPFKKTLLEIAVPSTAQAVLFFVISVVILFVSFFEYFAKFVIGDDIASGNFLNATLDGYVAEANKTPISEYAGSIIVWAIVGAIAYMAILAVANIVITGKNIASESNAENLHKKQDSFSLLDEYRRIFWIIIALGMVGLTLMVFIGKIFGLFQGGLESGNLFSIAIASVLLAINLYVVYMLVWVAVRNPNVLARD